MDRALLRRKALTAAGSVVLATTLGGCILTGIDTGKVDTSLTDTSADTNTETDTDEGPPSCVGVDLSDTAAYAECCDALAEWCQEEHGKGTDAANECIYGPDYDGSTGCIPWGPPVPPRFRGMV